MMQELKDVLKNVLCCPVCREKFVYTQEDIHCPTCQKKVFLDGRLIDFSGMSFELPFEFAKYLQQLYECAGQVMQDVKTDYRVQSVLEMVWQKHQGNICLEIGGADGVMTKDLETLFDTVLTTDCSKTFLKRIEAKTSKTLCLYNDAHLLPIQDGTIDTVVCSEVLEHVLIPTQFLMEIRRIMKKGGVCILSVPNEGTISLSRFKKNKQFVVEDTHINFYDPTTLEKLFFRIGLEMVEMKILRQPSISLTSLKSFISSLLTYFIPQIRGPYILCVLKVMENPGVYWEMFEKRIKS